MALWRCGAVALTISAGSLGLTVVVAMPNFFLLTFASPFMALVQCSCPLLGVALVIVTVSSRWPSGASSSDHVDSSEMIGRSSCKAQAVARGQAGDRASER